MAATVKCDTIVNASSATNNLALDASGNVTVGAGLTLTGGALTVGGSVGTAGQILRSTGSVASWVNGWTLINSTTASGAAALSDTTSLTSTYANYMVVVKNLASATNAVTMNMQIQTGGSFQTTGYSSANYTSTATSSTTAIIMSLAIRYGNAYPGQYTFLITDPSSTTTRKHITATGSYYDSTNSAVLPVMIGGMWTTGTGAITGFQILASSGNISGTVQVYGSN